MSARPPGVVSGFPNITPTFSRIWLINTTLVLDFEMAPVSLRRACDISLACRPTWESPISPSISDRGTSAATESTTTTSTAPLLTKASVISRACSPVSGCETKRLSMSTPRRLAYAASKACSASMKAATPPSFCASAMICSATVVLPEDSGPYISATRPRGMPPTPNARSSAIAPVGITSTVALAADSPRRIMEPFPNSFSI
ncbi:MAG: hypothetical protein BWY92_00235 [Firmicutes bacterium ADurb.BinA052]|nr:MAG: hypothetical protein BWY92_00235 [Firmicutes bacterium ADurb.BinA052]